jgi:lycopene cyclase domain-containing protein
LNLIYLIGLLVSLTGMALIDYRFKLAFFNRPLAATAVIAISVAFFSIWDLAGITLGIFFRGEGRYLSGLTIAPEFPIEELFFLSLLNYTTLICFTYFEKRRLAR